MGWGVPVADVLVCLLSLSFPSLPQTGMEDDTVSCSGLSVQGHRCLTSVLQGAETAV